MYQAITTKYLGGSRVKAKCEAGSLTLGWNDAWSSRQNHTYAAMQLAKKLGWNFKFHAGGTADGYAFVSEYETYWTPDYEPQTGIVRK